MSNASGKRPATKKKVPTRAKDTPKEQTFDVAEIERLIDLFERKNITEIEVERGGTRVKLGKPGARETHGDTSPSSEHTLSGKAKPAADSPLSDPGLYPITSPLVGTFYRSSSPDAKPYVEEGDHVRKGQTIGMIEAMKLMNTIESDVDGTVVTTLVENGTSVEYGEPLILIRP